MEVDGSEFSSFVASQEVEDHKRVSVILREVVARLEEDCRNLRKKEQSDRETIKRLLEEMEKKERNFREKLLEIECKKKKVENAVLEWKNEYAELEARVSKKHAGEDVAEFERKEVELKEKLAKLADDNKDVEARAVRVSDENCTLEGKVNSHHKEKEKKLTAEVDDGEDEIPLSKLYRKKRLAEVYEDDRKDSHCLKECSASPKLIELGCKGAQGIKTTKPVEVSEASSARISSFCIHNASRILSVGKAIVLLKLFFIFFVVFYLFIIYA
ncbi:uncharacterized protein A4U43_C06F13230 [Asparagus officinalis]|uniref:Uncharacterized protein n=1 Tax=Asparagus officinalis TaxID=4686 RepID=A0A5P1ELU9_ASPOF|nr:uncharacterized protein A4U43_C06F13230 [Asparagus officinalis]